MAVAVYTGHMPTIPKLPTTWGSAQLYAHRSAFFENSLRVQ